ncbi:hypothetical protein ACI3LY_003982 [Candidozyma auris]|uniref:Uncharacterized protein n=2 Tax=Candidozyma auris TaxID=498019 RepID=A0A2H1A1P4_CANAR|nr:hypothetical protein QG37_06273 [[Candida] auris]PIS56805.1 hypothetical protein B9J08_001350 [[Candida] auris]QWW23936.1 hypothetical protein CA7LBN_002770 [[Candida] auris]
MKLVYPWLIRATGWVLKNPKSFILVPILCIYILAYGVVHDLTIRPLNKALALRSDSGPSLDFASTETIRSALSYGNWSLTKISLSSENVVKFDSLKGVHALEEALVSQNTQNQTSFVVSPLATWPNKSSSARQFEESALRALNHKHKPELINLFFDGLSKKNHLITAATTVNLYVVHNASLPPLEVSSPLKVSFFETSLAPNAATEFLKYFSFLIEDSLPIKLFNRTVVLVQMAICIAFVFRVYFCICNQHKIRSNIGLVCGWLVEVTLASAAAVRILSSYGGFQEWMSMFGPVSSYGAGTYVLAVMLFSSRTLFRTINDLAGDNSMEGHETLHKRLIRFYLGINNSARNSSDSIYKFTRFVRKWCFVDKFSSSIAPIPNSFVVLCLNLSGLSLIFGFIFALLHIFFTGIAWHVLVDKYRLILEAIVLALAIDHFLQQTFLVGIILIDLNRVELTDLLSKNPNLNDPEWNESNDTMGEIDPISSFILGLTGPLARPKPSSLRHIVGTHILKLSPVSSSRFWLGDVLSFFFWNFFCQVFITLFVLPFNLLTDDAKVVLIGHQAKCRHSYDWLFYLEVGATILFIVAVSELTFTLTYSQRQRKEIDPTATLEASSSLEYTELAKQEQTKYFECITLNKGHNIDVIKIATNSKSSFLVSADLDRNVLVWSPLSEAEKKKPMSISTTIDSLEEQTHPRFWPVNHIEISDEGNYIVLVNYRHSVIKCFERESLSFIWEINLVKETGLSTKELKPMLAFFRKKTIAGFLARRLLMKRRSGSDGRRSSVSSTASSSTITGNYPPPPLPIHEDNATENKVKDFEQSLNRDEFVMVFEKGHMITVSCTDRKVRHYTMFEDVYGKDLVSENLRVTTAKQLTTSRVSDRILCDLVNGDIIIASAVNNVWKFSRLKTSKTSFNSRSNQVLPAPASAMGRTFSSMDTDFSSIFKQNFSNSRPTEFPTPKRRFAPINHCTIETIDFVGMVVRVRDLKAELLDTQTGIIIKTFFIGHFKPGSFRVIHSEPTHCKFCGCASVETLSLVYEDFYDPTLIVHTFSLENRKSRNNICLRVERDPREIRCLGFDATTEKQYWYHDIEKWEVTDMNVVMGIRRADAKNSDESEVREEIVDRKSEELSSLRKRKSKVPSAPEKPKLNDLWQGFVVTVSNGQLLEYKIPFGEDEDESEFACVRPNVIAKYGYKAVAIAFGRKIKILYLGGRKLIESDLYYKGSTSSLKPILQPSDAAVNRNELLFINKRRRMLERRKKKEPEY